jgi:predicted membrane chloride channel (bestrophin family)
MIDYRAGVWGFTVAVGVNGSLVPRALTMALPNAVLAFFVASVMQASDSFNSEGTSTAFQDDATSKAAAGVIASFTTVMIFILYNRSRTSYNRWWEGGTLLQKTRGEWFNAYSSIMAFTSTKPELEAAVETYCQLLARLMSLLMCCGLQQVSPNRDRPFEIIDLTGIDEDSVEFLNSAPDKVEVMLQWIQRSIILQQQTGVLTAAPPILSRAFQEFSRGIVNLQNARKIADFPYPYPLAQISMILQLIHWATMPIAASMALPRGWAVMFCFCSIFVLWCIHFNALDLEFPFGTRANDLPMNEIQQDWNQSIMTLLNKRGKEPPEFVFNASLEAELELNIVMSDASDFCVPAKQSPSRLDKGIAVVRIACESTQKRPQGIAAVAEKSGRNSSRSSLTHKNPLVAITKVPVEAPPAVPPQDVPLVADMKDPVKDPPVTIGAADMGARAMPSSTAALVADDLEESVGSPLRTGTSPGRRSVQCLNMDMYNVCSNEAVSSRGKTTSRTSKAKR